MNIRFAQRDDIKSIVGLWACIYCILFNLIFFCNGRSCKPGVYHMNAGSQQLHALSFKARFSLRFYSMLFHKLFNVRLDLR